MRDTTPTKKRRTSPVLHKMPTLDDITNLARAHGVAAIKSLVEVMQDGDDKSRIAAARELLDRGYGKARQEVKLEGKLDVSAKLPDEILDMLDGIYMQIK